MKIDGIPFEAVFPYNSDGIERFMNEEQERKRIRKGLVNNN